MFVHIDAQELYMETAIKKGACLNFGSNDHIRPKLTLGIDSLVYKYLYVKIMTNDDLFMSFIGWLAVFRQFPMFQVMGMAIWIIFQNVRAT